MRGTTTGAPPARRSGPCLPRCRPAPDTRPVRMPGQGPRPRLPFSGRAPSGNMQRIAVCKAAGIYIIPYDRRVYGGRARISGAHSATRVFRSCAVECQDRRSVDLCPPPGSWAAALGAGVPRFVKGGRVPRCEAGLVSTTRTRHRFPRLPATSSCLSPGACRNCHIASAQISRTFPSQRLIKKAT